MIDDLEVYKMLYNTKGMKCERNFSVDRQSTVAEISL